MSDVDVSVSIRVVIIDIVQPLSTLLNIYRYIHPSTDENNRREIPKHVLDSQYANYSNINIDFGTGINTNTNTNTNTNMGMETVRVPFVLNDPQNEFERKAYYWYLK